MIASSWFNSRAYLIYLNASIILFILRLIYALNNNV